jgi:hypothetical protein
LIWVNLLGLLLHLCDPKILRFVGEKNGSFHGFAPKTLACEGTSRILVHSSFSKGLLEEIIFKWGNMSWVLMVDYDNLPFTVDFSMLMITYFEAVQKKSWAKRR